MIDVILLQEDSKDYSDCRGLKLWMGEGITRRANKVEGEASSDKGRDLKGPSVTQRIMSAHRKDKKEGYGAFWGTERSHVWGKLKQSTS